MAGTPVAGTPAPRKLSAANEHRRVKCQMPTRCRVVSASLCFYLTLHNGRHITGAISRLTATVEENVLIQLQNLRTHPSVAAALARNELELYGWVCKFEIGQVFGYGPRQGRYHVVGHGPAGQGVSRARQQ